MRNILSNANRDVLRQFAWSATLLAFDYDGTLAPIVSDPAKAVMRRATQLLLQQVTRLYSVVVISGRGQPDALRRLQGTGVLEVVGNHGIEPSDAAERHLEEVRRWRATLDDRLQRFAGVVIEDKAFSIAVHYRRSREKKKARTAILEAAAELGGVRVIGGKQVVNLIPHGAPHKGVALERERARLNCDTAIYVGDDETDEDVFMLDQPGRLLTIRVGAKRSSAATYCLTNQRAMDDLLRALVDLRQEPLQQRSATR